MADLQRLAASAGCRLVATHVVGGELVGEFVCPDAAEGQPMATATLLQGLTDEDDPSAWDPAVVLAIRSAGTLAPLAVHTYVVDHVTFQDEAVETFASPRATLAAGAGDCDDSERAVVGLARAAGIGARLVYFLQDGTPAHVSAQLRDGGRWRWAETTIPARYGEHPFAAMRRLGLRRADLDGVPYVRENGRWRALKGSTMAGIGSAGDDWPSYLGDTFAATLIQWAASLDADPLDILKLLLSESGLQPSIENPRGFSAGQFAVGINQFAPVNWGYFSPMTAEQYGALTAEQQLPYVFQYWQNEKNAAGITGKISARDLYWLNFLPATYKAFALDSHIIVDSTSGYYAPNASLDHGGKGNITAGDLQQALDAQPGIHTTLWPLVSGAIRQDMGGPSLVTAVAILAAAAVVGILLARPSHALELVTGGIL